MIIFNACKKGSESDQEDKEDEQQETPTFYVKYKANGTLITQAEASALRGTSTDPKTLTLLGSGKDGANPKFKFVTTETFIGFVPGLNVNCSINSSDSDYVEFTNSAGLLHTTVKDSDGMHVAFFELSYTKDGIARGIFSGKIKAENGSIVTITDGEFRVKFTN